jgi:urease accessory protein
MEVRLGRGAGFWWLPHPCVPHAESVYKAINKVYLSAGSRLVWGEVLTCGRKLNGEVFAMSGYHARTEVFCEGELVLVENIFLKPSAVPVGSMGQLEGFTHQASLLVVGLEVDGAAVEACLSGKEGILYGMTLGPSGSRVVRILGNKAEQLYDCLKEIVTCIPS